MDPMQDAMMRGLVSPKAQQMVDVLASAQGKEKLNRRVPLRLKPGQAPLDERMQAASVPTGSALEDRGPDQRGYMRKLSGFFLDDPLLNEIGHAVTGGRYKQWGLMPLVTPLPSAKPGHALGADQIAPEGLLSMTKSEQAQFDAGKTPGSLDFELSPGQLEIPARPGGSVKYNGVP